MHVFEINQDINKLTNIWQGVSQTLQQQYEEAQQKVSKEEQIQHLKYLKKATVIRRINTRKLSSLKKREDDTLLKVQEVFTKTNYSCFKALGQLKELNNSAKLFMDELVQDQTDYDLELELMEDEEEEKENNDDLTSDKDKKFDDVS